MKMIEVVRYNLTLVFEPDPDGGYVVNCDELPELITEGDTLDEAFANAKDAFETILDAYKRIGRELPESIISVHKVNSKEEFRSLDERASLRSDVSFPQQYSGTAEL